MYCEQFLSISPMMKIKSTYWQLLFGRPDGTRRNLLGLSSYGKTAETDIWQCRPGDCEWLSFLLCQIGAWTRCGTRTAWVHWTHHGRSTRRKQSYCD
jgi:hypothetical protein